MRGAKRALDVGEQRAIVACLRDYLVVPPSPNATVMINIAWTENDFQLDIADPGNRTIYKRIIDRAADFGITHILFAPRNSDVSDRGNNTDAWGWEQILWFGMGQRLRLGLWEPGDPLPESLIEMLTYMKSKAVKPVAYVYPILAFLAGTVGCPKGEGRCDSGTNPPWIVNGSYDLRIDRVRVAHHCRCAERIARRTRSGWDLAMARCVRHLQHRRFRSGFQTRW